MTKSDINVNSFHLYEQPTIKIATASSEIMVPVTRIDRSFIPHTTSVATTSTTWNTINMEEFALKSTVNDMYANLAELVYAQKLKIEELEEMLKNGSINTDK